MHVVEELVAQLPKLFGRGYVFAQCVTGKTLFASRNKKKEHHSDRIADRKQVERQKTRAGDEQKKERARKGNPTPPAVVRQTRLTKRPQNVRVSRLIAKLPQKIPPVPVVDGVAIPHDHDRLDERRLPEREELPDALLAQRTLVLLDDHLVKKK